ncbi:hypothetical protein COLO4_37590 [Corchorus olitorius]|uniref:Uncharacterized protein n=1 Tax=Corchorus olitorius TaxID=93759 RepID=A0A1R3G0Q3_9ROSI|nr:hypothetical protein COLO4_37590 [Corchorus olitorius]
MLVFNWSARVLEADERSCEIIYGLNGVGEKGEPILVGGVEDAENRGKGKAKVTVTENESGDSGEKEKRHDCIFCAGMPDLHGVPIAAGKMDKRASFSYYFQRQEKTGQV